MPDSNTPSSTSTAGDRVCLRRGRAGRARPFAVAAAMLMLGVALAASVACVQPAVAHSPEGAEGAQTQSQASASERFRGSGSDGLWWLYVSALGLGGVTALGWALYRAVGDGREAGRRETASMSKVEPPGATSLAAESSTPTESLDEVEGALFSVEEVSPADQAAQFAVGQDDGPERVCPECGERFTGSVAVCPFDSTPLQKVASPGGDVTENEGGVLDRKMCPGCGRRYPLEARFCYHDGSQLHRDTVDDAEGAPVIRACEICGYETTEELTVCPEDGAELVTVAPDEDERLNPPVPVMKCPECGEIAEPGRARCPEDDEVLTPLSNAHADHLPHGGYGPPRKICEECGGKFSHAADYCPNDGAELIELN